MKKLFISILSMIFIAGSQAVLSQGFKPPSAGKAVVYFVRVTKYAGITSFEYFHQDKYIGAFKGQNYMRYECDPGQNLLWVSTENKVFVTSDLKEGGTYVVIVDVNMGAMKAHAGLTPVTEKDADFKRAKELVLSKAPVITPDEKIAKMNIELAGFIKDKLNQYETEWKLTENFKHISPDMAISPEAMN